MLRPILLAGVIAAIVGCQNRDPAPLLPSSYSGTLHGGMMAIGGESTGWVLTTQDQPGGLELDVSRVRDSATRLDGQRVIVSGHLTERQYVERGLVKVLMVESIAAHPDR
jgi:hypothetical protein